MINQISMPEFFQLMQDKGSQVTLLDVRETHEFQGGHIPGAIPFPLSQLPFKMNELSKDKTYYIVCQSGGRSKKASQMLQLAGYQVINIESGTPSWPGSLVHD